MANREVFRCDNKFYYELPVKKRIKLFLINDHWVRISKYLIYYRKAEYHSLKTGVINKINALYWERKKNTLGIKLGFFIPQHTLGRTVTIWHHGSIIINGDVRLGDGCILHGNNCIGNNGKSFEVPEIGDFVEVGFGACIIGGIKIADNTTIGAGAVVVRSEIRYGSVLAGNPANRI